MQKIIRKILFYHVLLVTGADNKVVESVCAVQLHNVPKNRHTAQFNHRLRFELAFFGNASAKATRENNYFHGFTPHLCLLFWSGGTWDE